jgi:hypothetical protein
MITYYLLELPFSHPLLFSCKESGACLIISLAVIYDSIFGIVVYIIAVLPDYVHSIQDVQRIIDAPLNVFEVNFLQILRT